MRGRCAVKKLAHLPQIANVCPKGQTANGGLNAVQRIRSYCSNHSMEGQNYFILIKEMGFFCFFIQFPYLSTRQFKVINNNYHIIPSAQITTIISITTR
jgi:hypothetical protein